MILENGWYHYKSPATGDEVIWHKSSPDEELDVTGFSRQQINDLMADTDHKKGRRYLSSSNTKELT